MKTLYGKELERFEKATHNASKLKVTLHRIKVHSVQAYMVSNQLGEICGGNLRTFILNDDLKRIDYPTVFTNERAAKAFIASDSRAKAAYNLSVHYLENIE